MAAAAELAASAQMLLGKQAVGATLPKLFWFLAMMLGN
jgi:hypothetical protein